MRKLILIVFLSYFSLTSFSQKHFVKGYVITTQNDTLFGFLKDRKNPNNFLRMSTDLYKKIKFKDENGHKYKYAPTNLNGYKIGNYEFASVWIPDNVAGTIFGNFGNSYNNIEKKFAKIIVKGYLSYYHYEYVDENGLNYTEYFKRENEYEVTFVRTGIFGLNKKALSRYFSDCPELVEMINSKKIKRPTEITNFYNNWYRIKITN